MITLINCNSKVPEERLDLYGREETYLMRNGRSVFSPLIAICQKFRNHSGAHGVVSSYRYRVYEGRVKWLTLTTIKHPTPLSTKPAEPDRASSSASLPCWLSALVSFSSRAAIRWITPAMSTSRLKAQAMLSKVLQKPSKALQKPRQATKPATPNIFLPTKVDPVTGVGFFASRATFPRSVPC